MTIDRQPNEGRILKTRRLTSSLCCLSCAVEQIHLPRAPSLHCSRRFSSHNRQFLDALLLHRIGNRQFRVQQPDLEQHTRLIPVHVLALELSSSQTDDRYYHDLDLSVRRRNRWKKPRHLDRMREVHVKLVDHTVCGCGS